MRKMVLALVVAVLSSWVAVAQQSKPPSQSMKLKGKLAQENKCWCMGTRPPPICTFVTVCQASGRVCIGSCD